MVTRSTSIRLDRHPNVLVGTIAAAYIATLEKRGGGEQVGSRLGLLLDESFGKLSLTLSRNPADPDAGAFGIEIVADRGAGPKGQTVIRARSEPMNGVYLGDLAITIFTIVIPHAILQSFKERSRKGTLNVAHIIQTGIPDIDALRLRPFRDAPVTPSGINAKTTFDIEQKYETLEAFVQRLDTIANERLGTS
tara:strand:- start:113 stop:691 length:579 start_codon:yes stop_codon:yes gene_type:complete